MDYRKILFGAGQSVGVIILFILLIVLITLIMMAFGPRATPTPEMVCNTIDGVAVCHI